MKFEEGLRDFVEVVTDVDEDMSLKMADRSQQISKNMGRVCCLSRFLLNSKQYLGELRTRTQVLASIHRHAGREYCGALKSDLLPLYSKVDDLTDLVLGGIARGISGPSLHNVLHLCRGMRRAACGVRRAVMRSWILQCNSDGLARC